MQPKPGFDIGNQNQGSISVWLLEPKLFIQNQNYFLSFFQMLLCFSATLEDMNFQKLEIGHGSS